MRKQFIVYLKNYYHPEKGSGFVIKSIEWKETGSVFKIEISYKERTQADIVELSKALKVNVIFHEKSASIFVSGKLIDGIEFD